VREKVGEVIREIAVNHGFEIDTMEIAQDHIHIFFISPQVQHISGSRDISASVIFEEHPEVKRNLWGGEFWEDGYFVRTVGDKVTAEVIRKYIEYHREEERTPRQLEWF